MQLALILGIAFTIGAVMFALQNTAAVSVSFVLWRFDSSLAVVLLLAMGLGVLIAGLVSSPTVIRGQWAGARLRREVAEIGQQKQALERRVVELQAQLAVLAPSGQVAATPATQQSQPYVGMVELLARKDDKR